MLAHIYLYMYIYISFSTFVAPKIELPGGFLVRLMAQLSGQLRSTKLQGS